MASTTYRHLGNVTEMYAEQEQFREVTKLVTKRHQFASIGNMVRNAGQLPQPFWLGRVDRKIALLRYVERLPLPDIAAQTHYSRTAVSYRLKGIEKMLDM